MAKVGKCSLKVPNGKLLKVTVEFHEGRIENVRVTGDFFIHPEESIEELETALKGKAYSRKSVGDAVEIFFARQGLIAFGITSQALTDAIMRCKEVVD